MTNAAALVVELEKLCADWLAPHLESLRNGQYRPRPKVINDALWGSIRLYAWEVALLDSKLLQRLRFLRQLGVVHWVYPSAHHSRLEHSLGALHQMGELLAALERNSTRAGEPPFDDATAKLMRLAALVHDCGHTVMSHVSEAFVEKLAGVVELRSMLKEKYSTRKTPSASEAFAAIFICSPAFKELLELPAVGADFINDVPKATEAIAALILGGPALEGRAYLTQLISGAFDADKLDYMPRDCLMAGVPSPLDVRRVIEKVRVFEVPHDKVPPDYIRWASVGAGRTKVLALSGSGRRALAELSMARTILYEKVYYHHKVRALEVMVRRALPHVGAHSVSEWLDLVDDDLMSQSMSPAASQ